MSTTTTLSFPGSTREDLSDTGADLPGFTVEVTVGKRGLLGALTGRRSGWVLISVDPPQEGDPKVETTFDMESLTGLLQTRGASMTGRSAMSRSIAWASRVPSTVPDVTLIEIEDAFLGSIGRRRIALDLSDPTTVASLEKLHAALGTDN